MYVAACPMCVASYGVIPHTYIRARPSGSVSVVANRSRVSCTRTAPAGSGPSRGTSGLVHARMEPSLTGCD